MAVRLYAGSGTVGETALLCFWCLPHATCGALGLAQMGTMDMPAAGAPAYASPRGARSESGRSTYSRRSRSARAAAAADENMPASRFIYVEASYRKYCEALAWAKEQVRCGG